eukprot:6603516-Lingulodinium_polyedra.AAC.1
MEHGVQLPSLVRGILLEEGAGLSAVQGLNLRVLTNGSLEVELVRQALLKMDMPSDGTRVGASKTYVTGEELDSG